MSRPRGGIIAGTLPAWTTTATSGIFTLREAQVMRTGAQWPRGLVAPTGLSAVAGNAQLSLSWTAPATTYGTITNYLVEYTPSGGSPQYVLTNSTSTSYTLTGLTNGTAYTVRVAAVTFTQGDYSASVSATPSASTPPTLHTPFGAVTGSGTVASPWVWQRAFEANEQGFKILTANSTVTLAGSLTQTGSGGCDFGEYLRLGVYSAANARLRAFAGGGDTLSAGQYVAMEVGCTAGNASIWIV